MSDKQETIPDIIAEMRRIKYRGEECTVKWCLTGWADRFEAAWKRESATAEKSSAVGDAAKMREIVELLARVILPPQEEYPAEYGGGKVPDEDGWLAWIRQMQVRALAALAAPARNCDRFKTLEDALAAWREVSPAESGPFDKWLFAEVKGGVK